MSDTRTQACEPPRTRPVSTALALACPLLLMAFYGLLVTSTGTQRLHSFASRNVGTGVVAMALLALAGAAIVVFGVAMGLFAIRRREQPAWLVRAALGVNVAILVVAAGVLLSSCAPQAAAIPRDFSLRMTRGGCEGSCPIYSVAVDSQGRVAWNGERFVRTVGPASSTVVAERLHELRRRIEAERVLTLEPGHHPCLDLPLVEITLTLGGRSIDVDYCDGDQRPEARRVITFAEFVDAQLLSSDWIGGREYRRMQ